MHPCLLFRNGQAEAQLVLSAGSWERRHPCLLFRNEQAEAQLVLSAARQAGCLRSNAGQARRLMIKLTLRNPFSLTTKL